MELNLALICLYILKFKKEIIGVQALLVCYCLFLAAYTHRRCVYAARNKIRRPVKRYVWIASCKKYVGSGLLSQIAQPNPHLVTFYLAE